MIALPDWSCETCIIVASGPSAVGARLEAACGIFRFVAINESWRLAPWADWLYGCDYAWWAARDGVPEFTGRKICGDARAAREPWGVESVRVRRVDALVLNEPGTVGRLGGQSGGQALNLVLMTGCRHIVLVGFDVDVSSGTHWHGDHAPGLHNPRPHLAEIWRRSLDAASPTIKAMGAKVINASATSSLTAYPKMPLLEAIHA